MTSPPMTNVVDLPCVPVIRDKAATTVSLRDLFATAHEITALGDSLLPVAREALLRFLESLGAAILKGADPDTLGTPPHFPAEHIDTFFKKNAHLFDLADRDKPLLQEWHTPEPTQDDLVKGYTDLYATLQGVALSADDSLHRITEIAARVPTPERRALHP